MGGTVGSPKAPLPRTDWLGGYGGGHRPHNLYKSMRCNHFIDLKIMMNLSEIEGKMKDKSPPSDRDKSLLQVKLNKYLTEDDHMFILIEILQKMPRKIYTITEHGTLFDLNDVDPEIFWKIYYHTQISIENHERQKKLDQAKLDKDQLTVQFEQKIQADLQKIKEQQGSCLPENQADLTPYEKLRINALQHCEYSTYAQQSHVTTGSSCESSSFSSNYRYKWKQTNKMDELAKKITNISSKSSTRETDPVGQRDTHDEAGEEADVEAGEEADVDAQPKDAGLTTHVKTDDLGVEEEEEDEEEDEEEEDEEERRGRRRGRRRGGG